MNLRAYARALWFTDLLLVVFFLLTLIFQLNTVIPYWNLTALVLSLILVPGSFVVNLLARLEDGEAEEHQGLIAKHVSVLGRRIFITRDIGYLLLYFFSGLVYVLTILMVWKVGNRHTEGSYFLFTYLLTLGFALVLSFLKISLSSLVACCRCRGCFRDVCVDVMTDKVAERKDEILGCLPA